MVIIIMMGHRSFVWYLHGIYGLDDNFDDNNDDGSRSDDADDDDTGDSYNDDDAGGSDWPRLRNWWW